MTDFNDHLRLSAWNYRIMELQGDELLHELENCTRKTIINWLQWNDPNGIYSDELSVQEFGNYYVPGRRKRNYDPAD